MMPSAVVPHRLSDAQWGGMRRYILKNRQRQRQEREADAEVQRQRREREKKQKENVMTLEEVKEQISALETKLASLTEEKHQLFLALKRVLNEDDRRNQLIKEPPAEMMSVGATYASIAGPSVFLQSLPNRTLPFKVATATGSIAGPLSGSSGAKRPRSPSPPLPPGHPGYHQYNYKSNNFSHKPDYVRAVLWNKGPAATYGGVYGVTPTQPVYSYAQPTAGYDQVYLQRPVSSYEAKPEPEKVYMRGPQRPMTMSIHPAQQQKPGGITTGFPVRATHQPTHVNPQGVFITQGGSNPSRLLYGSAPTSVPTPRYQSAGAI